MGVRAAQEEGCLAPAAAREIRPTSLQGVMSASVARGLLVAAVNVAMLLKSGVVVAVVAGTVVPLLLRTRSVDATPAAEGRVTSPPA